MKTTPKLVKSLTAIIHGNVTDKELYLMLLSEDNGIIELITQCSDIRNPDGSLNERLVAECKELMFNTLHMYTHGMSELELVYRRANANDPNFGQYNFIGGTQPAEFELTNALNFLTRIEMNHFAALISAAHMLMTVYIDENGPIPYDQMLRMFHMYCSIAVGRAPPTKRN